MTKGLAGAFIALTCVVTTLSAHATVHRVYPGESIQAAIDIAAPGDTILVEPGDYTEPDNGRYGLRISTDNLRLIGKSNSGKGKDKSAGKGKGKPKANKVRIIAGPGQETGILAAPALCEYDFNAEQCRAARGENEITYVKNFYIRGFSVEGFPKNGIQTRWVDGFEFVRNESANNLNNGIYPTLSANGMVRNNVSYGSLDTAMWVAGSENVRVIGNELYGSVIGFEITVSNNVTVHENTIYQNSVGVGLFHPDGAGNPPLPEMKNWVIENNDIYDNNRENDAPDNSFQKALPPGGGVLLLGVSDHKVLNNRVRNNGYVGIAVFGWCTSLFGTDRACTGPESDPLRPRDASNNLIRDNRLLANGTDADLPPPVPGFPDFTQDLAYFHLADVNPAYTPIEPAGSGNCFEGNVPEDGVLTIFSSFKMLLGLNELPTDGC